MAVQFETLILPCVISITAALIWITFLLKEVYSKTGKSRIRAAFAVSWFSVILFLISLTYIISIIMNIVQAFDTFWAETFIAGWILLVISNIIFHTS